MSRKKKHVIPDDVSASQLSELIDEYCLDENARKILKRRFIDNIKFEDLAYEFGLSVNGVKNIVYRHGDRVLLHL